MRGPYDHRLDESAESDALLRAALWILVAYLALTVTPIVRWSITSGTWWPTVLHSVVLLLVMALAQLDGVPAWARGWSPLVVAPYLYIELRWAIPGAGRPHADAQVMSWEAALFPSDPSQTLAGVWGSPALSELLHFCYLSYYPLMYLPPTLLWIHGRRREFAATLIALAMVYSVCFLAYVLFPVDGPRFIRGPAVAPDGPVRSLVLAVLESGSSRGSAFPSSHVAAAVVAAMCALRFQRAIGVIVSALAVGLAVGAVYGGYHYAVDIIAGVLTGIACVAAAYFVERRTVSARAARR